MRANYLLGIVLMVFCVGVLVDNARTHAEVDEAHAAVIEATAKLEAAHRAVENLADTTVEAQSIQRLSEVGFTLRAPKNVATRIDSDQPHVSYCCAARTAANVVRRGGPDVALDGGVGVQYCETCTAGALICGDAAVSFLTTKVDAGVTLDCTAAYP